MEHRVQLVLLLFLIITAIDDAIRMSLYIPLHTPRRRKQNNHRHNRII